MEDILLAENFELQLSGGLLVKGESTEQHQQLLLLTYKGDWRFTPRAGVGIEQFLKDEDEGLLLPEIKEQFELDRMKVNQLKWETDRILINAFYKNDSNIG